ncbi:MAG: hypothetical protein ABI690_34110, partial [Chloroflexota bacterium]
LLGQGRHIIYKRQDVNYYWYENGSTLTTWNQGGSQHPKQPTITKPMRVIQGMEVSGFWVSDTESVLSDPRVFEKQSPVRSLTIHRNPDKSAAQVVIRLSNRSKPKESRSQYQQPLADDHAEQMAQKIYSQMRQNARDTKGYISRTAARRLVITYGVHLVEQALAVIAQRKNIDNPTGFLMIWLRSESHR